MPLGPDDACRLHPDVSLRDERFGALAYHHGNRRLVFVRSTMVVDVLKLLGERQPLREALVAAGVPDSQWAVVVAALERLRGSEMLDVG